MNTLDDLRRTLDHHSHDVHDDAIHARTAAVRGRAVVVRRRRAAGIATAAALAVIGAVGLPQLPDTPISDPTGGAPDVRTALGWTYRFDDMVHSNGGSVEVELEDATYPRLLSWSTDGADQEVEVRAGWAGRFQSDRADFDDHVVMPAGYSGKVRLTGPEGLTLATYSLDPDASPDGVGAGPRTFREDVAGLDFLGAAAGEPGQASVEFDLVPRRTTTWLGYYCEQLPKGYRMHINWSGARGSLVFGACDEPSSFDPGGSPGTGLTTGRRAGTPQTMRMWVTRGGEEVADGELPDLLLGLGAYTASETPVDLLGLEKRQQVEHAGHVYRIVADRQVGAGEAPRLEVPDEGQFLVGNAVRARGRVTLTVTADGRRLSSTSTFNVGGTAGSGEDVVPAGSVVGLDFGRTGDNVRASGLALYERID